MGADEPPTDSEPNRPRAVPPPLPIRVPTSGWVVVATFPSHAQWHAATRALSRHGIAARMDTLQEKNAGVDLLVMCTEAEWAKDLIARGDESPSDGPTGGFPLHDARITPLSGNEIRAIPVQSRLTEAQQARYSAAIIVLCVIVAIIVVLMFLPLI
jgi:hypothetical protein